MAERLERANKGDGMDQITWGDRSYGDMKIIGGTKGEVSIGKYCSLGEGIKAFMSHDHEIKNITSFPFLHTRRMKNLKVKIGNDVFIGSHSVIFRDVTIGDGAVIGAYSVITKDVPPYTIVVGNDRVVGKRFSDDDIAFLLKFRWWNLSKEEIDEIVPILCQKDVYKLRLWKREHYG